MIKPNVLFFEFIFFSWLQWIKYYSCLFSSWLVWGKPVWINYVIIQQLDIIFQNMCLVQTNEGYMTTCHNTTLVIMFMRPGWIDYDYGFLMVQKTDLEEQMIKNVNYSTEQWYYLITWDNFWPHSVGDQIITVKSAVQSSRLIKYCEETNHADLLLELLLYISVYLIIRTHSGSLHLLQMI